MESNKTIFVDEPPLQRKTIHIKNKNKNLKKKIIIGLRRVFIQLRYNSDNCGNSNAGDINSKIIVPYQRL